METTNGRGRRKKNPEGLKTITIKADVTFTVGSTIHPTVFMSEAGKARFINGVAVLKAHYNLPADSDASYKIIGIPSSSTIQICLRIGGVGICNETLSLGRLREGWFGQEHYPWLFCDSWESYDLGQEPDYLNGGKKQ